MPRPWNLQTRLCADRLYHIIPVMRKYLTRRDFLKLCRAVGIELTLLTIGGAGYGLLMEPGRIKVETLNLRLQRLTQAFHGLRMAQISDIHMGGWMLSGSSMLQI